MLSSALLKKLGVFVAPGFLSRPEAADLQATMLKAQGAPATVTVDLHYDRLDEEHRRTLRVAVPEATVEAIHERLRGARADLEAWFRVTVDPRCERPQFLVYPEGGYIRRHSDGAEQSSAPAWLRRRRISLVLLVNDHSDAEAEGTFAGGALTFYGLVSATPRGKAVGFPLAAEAGTLVAFPADMVHEVTPVTRGRRLSVVSWFLDPVAPTPPPA